MVIQNEKAENYAIEMTDEEVIEMLSDIFHVGNDDYAAEYSH